MSDQTITPNPTEESIAQVEETVIEQVSTQDPSQTQSTDVSDLQDPRYVQDSITAVQAVIERLLLRSDALKAKMREMNDSLKSFLENDEQLSKASEKAEEASIQARERKKSLTNSEEYKQLSARLREIKEEMKEISDSLNTHLLTYYTQTGVKVLDLSTGEREFSLHAKVKSKNS